MAPERLLTVAEVAGLLSVSKATVYKLCDAGAIEHVRVSNSLRFNRASVDAFVARHGAGAAPSA